MACGLWLAVFCSLLIAVTEVSSFRRNLSEITYHFTNCGSTNKKGPNVNSECLPFYRSIDSLITANERLFSLNNGNYDGAQGFRLPRNGLYNITIAGARGGEGVCNYHYGLGHVQRLQAQLTTDYEYLIMVGHRGTSVCQVEENAGISVCQEPRPTNLDEANSCGTDLLDYLLANVESAVDHIGGGGGGGASMIWPRRVSNEQFTSLPIVIAPGGGGASAILDYDNFAILLLESSISTPNDTHMVDMYDIHVNPHSRKYLLSWPEGVRGIRPDGVLSSGSGGGWTSILGLPFLTEVDGKLLSQRSNFAEGGSDCSSSLESESLSVFTEVFGGYGGGGGGCGSGGGGGGYTGGHVLQNRNHVPGGGGDVGIFDDTVSVTILDDSLNDGDGYVEIVASNCECAGQCEVFTEEGQFECSCPNGTLHADDGSSCYQGRNVSFEAVSPLSFTASGETVYLTGLQLNSSLNIFGLDMTLSVTPRQDSGGVATEDLACALVFVGSNNEFVLVSNPVRGSFGRSDQLSLFNTTSSTSAATYVSLLDSPVLVTGALLISNEQCSLTSSLQVFVSIEVTEPPLPVVSFQYLNETSQQVITSVSKTVLGLSNNNPTQSITTELQTTMSVTVEPTTEPPVATVEVSTVIAITVGIAVGLVIVIGLMGIVICTMRKKRKRMKRRQSKPMTKIMEEYNSFLPKTRSGSNQYTTLFQELISTIDDPLCYKNMFTSFSVSHDSLTVGEEIGRGAFGVVYQGTMKSENNNIIDVAIKKIGNLGSQSELQAFLDESSIMITFKHTNILSIAGVCFDSPDGVPLLLLPFMANGSLKDYLKKKRAHVTDYETMPEGLNVTVLVRMCMDIADGMEYLASERFVHRDLAARNCMVDQTLVVRVGDFGLTRDIYTDDYYRAHQGTKVPVKWMAPEALNDRISNEKTDVWSFGVTCWEVFSLGRSPYPGVDNHELIDYITVQNKRLTKPTLCPQRMFDIALSVCWKLLPEERPTFESLTQQLKKYWSENMYEIYV